MLEAANLGKTFSARNGVSQVRAVDGIDFTVSPGETYGLLGPNGAGKTTTMRIVAGLLRPTSGDVRFDGHPVGEAPEQMRELTGMVTESGGVYNRLTGDEYLSFFARMFGMDRHQTRTRIDELIGQFDLADCRRRRLGTFSKGMKQKMNLARALLHSPRLLLLDEPTSGLDPAMTETLWTVLGDLCQKRSVVTLLCTHNLDEADRLCDRVAIIVKGRIIKEGKPDRLKSEEGASEGQTVKVKLANVSETILGALRQIEGVRSIGSSDDGVLRIGTTCKADDVNPLIAKRIIECGGDLILLQPEVASLREVYLRAIKGGRE